MIAPELVDRVRESADIVQIIGEYVKLKRAGADFRGPCPFHGGKNPNFSVSPRRAMYHCFKCGESGNVFTFLQKHLGMSFPDAVRSVAATEGIDIPETAVERSGPDPREPFWEVNATAGEYFRTTLWNDAAGQDARGYLERRGVSRDVAERFGLGFALRDGAPLRAHMSTMGFTDERMLDAGVLIKPEGQSEVRARFRGRLMFPIFDALGHPVGFGGRAMGDAEPKYLNSPETPVFQKGKTLYALNWTKNDIRKDDRVFVVEGYFDAIRLMASGINTVVAPLGTALTPDQAALLARYTKNVYLLYDSDAAGLKATFRAGDELLRLGMAVRVITLPDGDDPDTFVLKHGPAALEAQVSQSVDIFERKLQILARGGWFDELQKKRRALDRLLPTIRATADALLRDLYITRTAELTGIAKPVLLREANEAPAHSGGHGRGHGERGTPSRASARPSFDNERASSEMSGPSGRNASPERSRRPRRPVRGGGAERELVRAMLADPTRVTAIAERVGADRFRDPRYRAIFEAMLAMDDEDVTVERLVERSSLSPDEIEVVNELQDELDAQIDPAKTIEASIADLELRELRERMLEIDTLLPVASEDQQTELMQEKRRLQREIELSGQPDVKSYKFFQRRASTRE